MGKYIRGGIDEQLSLGTLAALDVIVGAFDEVVNGRTLVSSIVATWAIGAWTDDGSGPLMVGIAHGDYADAEIEEFIEATGSWDEGNLTEQEISQRKIRRIGSMTGPISAPGGAILNDGKPVKTKLNWILNDGETLKFWCYNQGAAPLATTVPVLRIEGHANLWPR